MVGFGKTLQAIEAAGPELVEEPAQLGHPGVVGPVEVPGAVAPVEDELRLTQDAQVLGDRRPGHVLEPGGDHGGGELVGPDDPEDLAAAGLGQGLEGGVHGCIVSQY